MQIQAISPNFIKKQPYNKFQQNAQNNNINFGAGEDYGCDLDAPEPDPTIKPGFKKGLLGIVTALTFPISIPAMIMYEKYKDSHPDDVKTNMNYDNIED